MENDKTPQPSYFAIISAEVRYSPKLNAEAKLLYGEITALANKRGYCFASNGYFGKLYSVDDRTVRRWIGMLQKSGFINVTGNTGKNRRLYPIVKADESIPDLDDPGELTPAKSSKKKAAKAPKEKKPRVTLKFEPGDMRLSQLLRDRSVINFPHLESKKTDLEKWANEIRLLRQHIEEMDAEDQKKGKPVQASTPAERIEFMIVWIHGGTIERNGRTMTLPPDDFWPANILSADKLRKQWDEKLMPKMQKWVQGKVKKHVAADLSQPAPRGTRQPEQVAQL